MDHVEWEDHASDLHVAVLTQHEATEDLRPAGRVYEPFVLLLSSGGGGALAVGGTRESLLMLADKIRARVDRVTRPAETQAADEDSVEVVQGLTLTPRGKAKLAAVVAAKQAGEAGAK